MSARGGGRRADLYALGFIMLVSIGVTWQVTVGGKALLPTGLYLRMQPWRAHAGEFPEYHGPSNPLLDPVQQHYPWRVFAHNAVRSGVMPLWNPQMLCGTPFLGNGQSAVFYPETWLHYLMDPLHALGWATTLMLFIAGSLTYAFLRTIGLAPIASTVGAVTFMLNGFFVGWLCFPTMRSVPAWLPLMLLGFERAVRSGRGRWLLLVALGTGMQFLAGHLHASLLILIIFAAYAGARLTWRAGERDRLRIAGLTVGALALGTMIAAAQLAPSFEMAGLSSRTAGQSYQALIQNALAPPQALLGLMPDIFGSPADQNHWGAELNTWWGRTYRSYSETSWYFGLGPLILALAGLALRPRRQSWFWLGVAVFGGLLAFGTWANWPLFLLIPGYSQLSGIGRAVLLTCVGGSVLAALGAQALLDGTGLRRDPVRTVSAVAGALLVIGLIAGMSVWIFTGQLESAGLMVGSYTLMQVARFCVVLVLSAVVIIWAASARSSLAWLAVIGVITLDLALVFAKFTPEGPTEYLDVKPAIIDAMDMSDGPWRVCSIGPDFLNRVSPNTGMLLGLEEAQGSDSLVWAPYQRLLNEISTDKYGLPQIDPDADALDWMNVKYLITPLDIERDRWQRVTRYETNVYVNEDVLPRAFLCADLDAPTAIAGEVSVTDYGINRIVIGGDMPEGRDLFVSTANYPGWHAYADGVQVPIITAKGAFQAVRLTRRTQEVVLTFLPGSFHVGAFASLLGCAILLGLGTCVAVRRRRDE
jgi:hypothetical protein